MASVHPKRELEAGVLALTGLSDEHQSEQLDSGSLRSLTRIGWATSAVRRAKALHDQTPQDLIQSGLDAIEDDVKSKLRDELGISQIYMQAKRYAQNVVVGRPTVQSFVGALATRGATVGVLSTTSRFSAEATDAASAKNSLSTASQCRASSPPQGPFA